MRFFPHIFGNRPLINDERLVKTGPILCYNSFENACQALANIDLWSEEYYTLIREIHATEPEILAMSNLWDALNHTESSSIFKTPRIYW